MSRSVLVNKTYSCEYSGPGGSAGFSLVVVSSAIGSHLGALLLGSLLPVLPGGRVVLVVVVFHLNLVVGVVLSVSLADDLVVF